MTVETVYAGIDIGGTNIKFGLVNAEGQVLYREQRPTMAEKGATPLMHLVTNIAERLLYFAADEELPIRHLGVGTPGAVDFPSGRVVGPSPNIPGWQGMEIGTNLRDRLNMPVFVDNDANAVVLAEATFGAAVGSNSTVCVTVGTGVGGGIIIDKKIWRGATSSAAELGHITIDVNGPVCGCGQKGCIEALCASQAIISRARVRLEKQMTPVFKEILDDGLESLTIKKLFAAYHKGDEVAAAALAETARFLGIGLAGVVNLLNPETVVIGGGVSDGGGFVEMVAAEIKKRAFDSAVKELRVVRASLGNNAGFIGAGLLGEQSS